MRNLTALVLLLLCSLYLASGSSAFDGAGQICCGATVRFRIPLQDIISYWNTGNSCFVEAIMFEVKSGRRICVDPTAPWVEHHMKAVDLRKQTQSATADPPPPPPHTPLTLKLNV